MSITDLITPTYLKQTLLGSIIPLMTRTGVTISDDALWAAIDEAVTYLENEFGLALRKTRFVVNEDRMRIHQRSSEQYQLSVSLKRPVQEITSLSVQLGNLRWFTLPKQWVYVSSKIGGVMYLIPTSQGIGDQGSIVSYQASFYNLFRFDDFVPGYYGISYTAGFESDLLGTHTVVDGEDTVTVTGLDDDVVLQGLIGAGEYVKLGDILYRVASVSSATYRLTKVATAAYAGPAVLYAYEGDILQYVSYAAVIPILAVVGAAIYGAGIIGTSLKLDGLAQSKNINPRGPFANLADTFTQKMEASKASIYAKYASFNMVVI